MKKLLNTLYVLSEDSYLRLDGENIVIQRDDQVAARFPLHTLENIICFNYAGASPQLMGTQHDKKRCSRTEVFQRPQRYLRWRKD